MLGECICVDCLDFVLVLFFLGFVIVGVGFFFCYSVAICFRINVEYLV